VSIERIVTCDKCGKPGPMALESEDPNTLAEEAGWECLDDGVGGHLCSACMKKCNEAEEIARREAVTS